MSLTIAFVSCMDAERCPEQPVWQAIAAQQPDVLLLLGDVIYMDWGLASLAKVPGARRLWEDVDSEKKAAVLAAFADEMHDRYAQQWAVEPFRDLMQQQRQRHIVLTWDDHDFAWNNALGVHAGKSGLDEKAVPQPFKDIALLARQRFEWVLRHSDAVSYPTPAQFPNLNAVDLDAPVFDQALPDAHLLVLDQRWHRTHRDAKAPALLSKASQQRLLQAVMNGDGGLLIVAGSSPLKHHSLSGGHSSWWAEPDVEKTDSYNDRAYPEYTQIMLKATRPVLYLGGEIHRNAWGGWVEDARTDGSRLPVVQALSSGAALGKLFFHEFRPSYGLVRVVRNGAQSTVQVDLHTLDPAEHDPRTLHIVAGQWLAGSVAEGECTNSKLVTEANKRLLSLIDGAPLPVLAFRRLGREFGKGVQVELLPEGVDREGLTDNLPANPAQSWPTALRVQGVGGQIRLDCISLAEGAAESAPTDQLVQETFEIARSKGRSVLLFIHGFGKGAAAAMSQALDLRQRFNCEVLLFTWPTSSGSGLFAALAGFKAAKEAAQKCAGALDATLGTFCNMALSYQGVPTVVLARSLGAQALAEVGHNALRNLETRALSRLVLSAPACTAKKHDKWLAAVQCPVVITVNRKDCTLRLADMLALGDKLLGSEPVEPLNPAWAYLDCTDVQGVGTARAHDYLYRQVEPNLAALNQSLLTGQEINFTTHRVPGLVCHQGGQLYPPPPPPPP